MNKKSHLRTTVLTIFVLWAFIFQSIPGVRAQEIVTSEDISGGSSVFVFRQSKKTAQTKSAFRSTNVRRNAVARNETRRKVKSQIVAVNNTKPQRTKIKVDPKTVTTAPKATTVAQKEKASNTLSGAAEVYLERKQTDTAIQYFRDAIALNPKNENARLGLSEALTVKADEIADRGNQQSALPLYEEAVKLNGKNAAAFAALGEIYDDLNQNEKAISNYEKALQLSPELTELQAPLGVLYLQKGEIALAENYLTKATTTGGASGAETQYFKGLLLYKQNKNPEALAAFSNAIKLKSDYSEAYYYQGETYDRLDKDKEAIAAYKEAVRLNPRFTEAWFDLGVAYYNRNRFEDAVAAYKEAVRLKNDNGEAHLNLANAYRQLARYAEANAEYGLAAQFIKGDADMFSEWGFCLGKERKWNKAVERLDTAVAMRPDPVDYTNLGWAYYNAAQEDLRAKREPDAKAKLAKGRDALQQATVLDPNFAAAFLNLGITLTDLGDYQASVRALTRAIELRKNWVSAINELGLAYRQLNDFDNAVKQFKKVTDIDGKFAPGFYNLGEAEYRRGNKKEARKAQEKLKKLNPYLAAQLDVIVSGMILQETKQQIQNKVPKPKLPY